MTMYFMPASLASVTHSSALYLTGLKREASVSYSRTGMRERNMIHSPRPTERWPFHSPAGIAYRPQWMKRPYFASRNHSRRFSLAGSTAALKGCATEVRSPPHVAQAFRPALAATPAPAASANTSAVRNRMATSDVEARRQLNHTRRRGGGKVNATLALKEFGVRRSAFSFWVLGSRF